MAESFGAKRKAGTVQAHGSGFGGSGFKFNAEEDERHNNERKVRLPSASIPRKVLENPINICLNLCGTVLCIKSD